MKYSIILAALAASVATPALAQEEATGWFLGAGARIGYVVKQHRVPALGAEILADQLRLRRSCCFGKHVQRAVPFGQIFKRRVEECLADIFEAVFHSHVCAPRRIQQGKTIEWSTRQASLPTKIYNAA